MLTRVPIGSSPRVRGPRSRSGLADVGHRFIPARAGTACVTVSSGSPNPGSSPRVRGPRLLPAREQRVLRFIPARAGTAAQARRADAPQSVHPRACGDRVTVITPADAVIGSSPRVRGPRLAACAHRRVERFIPARAGTARGTPARRRPDTVHPRACGDRMFGGFVGSFAAGSSPRVRGPRSAASARIAPSHGSSPRVRGPHVRRLRGVVRGRFIPARAGTACTGRTIRTRSTVHPRACGDRVMFYPWLGRRYGSSPRVRGPRAPVTAVECVACGSSPRVRGPLMVDDEKQRRVLGSSPRVRGPRREPLVSDRPVRFIPARAGTASNGQALAKRDLGSSPRVRGPRRRRVLCPIACSGSSPRVRGPRRAARAGPSRSAVHPRACGDRAPLVRLLHADVRFIPARAGTAALGDLRGDLLAVHPRACGDRGAAGVAGVLCDRFIPARAGTARTPGSRER